MDYFQLLTNLVILLVVAVRTTISCDGFSKTDFNQTQVPPKMMVHSTPGKVKIVDTTVLIEGIGVEIRIDCWAPFPIDFEFHGHLSNRDATVNVIERRAPNYTDISTYCFHINITVRAFEEMTGEYVCFQVQNQSARTSYYIYPAARPPETILNRGQSIIVEAQLDKEWVTFPCATSNPNISVNLYNDKNEILVLNDNVKYDPKTGFKVKVSQDLWGKYQCRTDLSKNDVVEIHLRPPKGFLVVPPEKVIILKEGDILKVSCESTEDISIEADSHIPKKRIQGRPLHEGRKLDFFLEFESGVLRAQDSGTVACVTKSENRTLWEWVFQVREAKTGSLRSATVERFNAYSCNGGPSPKLTLFECNSWVECKMRTCKKMDRTCVSKECKDSQTVNCFPSGILQCYDTHNVSTQEVIYFSGLQKNNSYTNWSTAPTKDILRIRKFFRTTQNSTSAVTAVNVVCEGSSFVFADGFKWFLATKQGSQSEVSKDNIENKWRSEKSKHIIKSTARINISSELSTITCKAPVWNSTEWKDDVLNLADLETRGVSSSAILCERGRWPGFIVLLLFPIWSTFVKV